MLCAGEFRLGSQVWQGRLRVKNRGLRLWGVCSSRCRSVPAPGAPWACDAPDGDGCPAEDRMGFSSRSRVDALAVSSRSLTTESSCR